VLGLGAISLRIAVRSVSRLWWLEEEREQKIAYAERLAIEWSYVSKTGMQRPRYAMIVLEVAIERKRRLFQIPNAF
jgi:hypothetical protein